MWRNTTQTPYDRVFKSNPEALFYELNRIHAEFFEHPADGTRTLVPSVLYEEADEYYASFGINCPYKLLLTNMEGVLVPYLQPEKKDRICKALIFSMRPYAAAETILAAKRKKQEQAEEKLRQKNAKLKESAEKLQQPKEKRKRGRPLGAKNKKTLEREAELARLAREGKLPEKRKRGRPLGSKKCSQRARNPFSLNK